ncbi:MAG: phage protein Gp27 family protein [Smithellaceae bacterium]
MSARRKIRRRSRIETELPDPVRKGLDRILLEGATYEEATEWVRQQGYDISKSSVGRYGIHFLEAYQNIVRFADQSRALTSDAGAGLPMEEAVGKMLLQKVMAALLNGTADIAENSRLISDVAKLQSSNIQLAKLKMDLAERTRKTADAVEKIVKKGGLSADAADQIRAKILGIAK